MILQKKKLTGITENGRKRKAVAKKENVTYKRRIDSAFQFIFFEGTSY